MPLAKGALSGAVALLLGLGASGCHTYKYFDISYSWDYATVDRALLGGISRCRIHVSGADTDSFPLMGCPNLALNDPNVGGSFEFSSFADSGTMTFDFLAYQGLRETADCQVGEGKVDVPVTGLTTIMGSLLVKKTGDGCANVTPPSDGAP
jgi:hypothetical protein